MTRSGVLKSARLVLVGFPGGSEQLIPGATIVTVAPHRIGQQRLVQAFFEPVPYFTLVYPKLRYLRIHEVPKNTKLRTANEGDHNDVVTTLLSALL